MSAGRRRGTTPWKTRAWRQRGTTRRWGFRTSRQQEGPHGCHMKTARRAPQMGIGRWKKPNPGQGGRRAQRGEGGWPARPPGLPPSCSWRRPSAPWRRRWEAGRKLVACARKPLDDDAERGNKGHGSGQGMARRSLWAMVKTGGIDIHRHRAGGSASSAPLGGKGVDGTVWALVPIARHSRKRATAPPHLRRPSVRVEFNRATTPHHFSQRRTTHASEQHPPPTASW